MTRSRDEDTSGHQPPETYDVGYKKPPKHSRWPKGRSGNPKGRPRKERGRMSLDQLLVQLSHERFELKPTLNLEGKSNLEVLAHKMFRDALTGKKPAMDRIFSALQKAETYEAESADYAARVRAKLMDMARRNDEATEAADKSDDAGTCF